MITTNRDRNLTAHTTPDVKQALYAESKKTKKSVSKIVHDLLVEGLQRQGYDVTGHEYRIKQ